MRILANENFPGDAVEMLRSGGMMLCGYERFLLELRIERLFTLVKPRNES